MLALILNPNDELKLIEYSKNLAERLTTNDCSFYTAFPLWSIIDKNKTFKRDELKEFAKSILEARLDAPLCEDNSLYLPLHLDTGEIKIDTRLTLLKAYSKKNTALELSTDNNISSEENFPMQLKIFKIANVIKHSKNSQALSDFVWKKL